MTDADSKPLVSIIVPVYNVEEYLAACLESLMLQTYRNIEVICIDDGSSDNSRLILDAYAAEDGRIRVVEQRNGGAARARNHGLKVARGDYILFVDSDDYIALDACEALVGIALRDSADIVVFGGKSFPTVRWKDGAFAQRDISYSGAKVVDALFYEPGGKPLMCNKLYSRAMLDSCGARFNEDLELGEDHAFQFFVFPHAQTVSFTGRMLYFYRGRDESLVGSTDTDFDVKSRQHFTLVRHIVDTWAEAGHYPERLNDFLPWLAEFLYGSMKYTSFDLRCEISSELNDLVQRHFDDRAVGFLDETLRRKLEFMLDSRQAAVDPPLVSFAVASLIGERLAPETLQAMLSQSEQRIECVISGDCRTDAIAAMVAADSRCRFADVSDLPGIVRECRGSYIVPASCNCVYDCNMAADALDFLDYENLRVLRNGDVDAHWRDSVPRGSCALGVDIVSFCDFLKSIRCEDVFIGYEPNNAKPFLGSSVFRLDDIRPRSFCALSLAPGNKMYRSEFLAGCVSAMELPDGAHACAHLALALERAEEVAVLTGPMVTFAEFDLTSPDGGAADPADALKAHLDALAACADIIRDDARAGFSAALSQYCLTLDDSLCNPSCYEGSYGALAGCIRQCAQSAGEVLLFPDPADAAQAAGLAAGDARAHFARKNHAILQRVQQANAAQIEDIVDLRDEVRKLWSRIDLAYDSVSYRVGKAITEPARKAFYAVKARIGG